MEGDRPINGSASVIWKILLIVVAPYAAGYAARRLKLLNERQARIGIIINVLCFSTSVGIFGIWGIKLERSVKFLPIAGFVITFIMLVVNFGISHFLKLDDRGKGSFIFGGSLSNMGFTMGGILCYYYYGKEGYGRSLVYILFFSFIIYFVCFPFARFLTGKRKLGFLKGLKSFFLDIRTAPLYAYLAGIGLTVAGVGSPKWSNGLLKFLIPIASIMGMGCIGVSLRFTRITHHMRLFPLVFIIKFAFTPLVAFLIIKLFGFGGLDRKVIFLLSFMPPAVWSIYLSSFFDLDVDLANSLFVAMTIAFFVLVLPFLAFFL